MEIFEIDSTMERFRLNGGGAVQHPLEAQDVPEIDRFRFNGGGALQLPVLADILPSPFVEKMSAKGAIQGEQFTPEGETAGVPDTLKWLLILAAIAGILFLVSKPGKAKR